MKKIVNWIKKNYLVLLPVLLLVILIISIWDGNFNIGGDNVVPLNPHNNIYKSTYVWELENRGVSGWRYMLFLWQMPFYLLSLLHIPPSVGIKIFIVSILVSGFVFTYLFFRALFKGSKYDNKSLALFCGFAFILSASSILILPTTIFLSALPLCSYLFVKYLDTNKFRYIVFLSVAVNHAYIAQLPQAKYLFIVSAVLFFVLLLYLQLRSVRLRDFILKLVNLLIFTFLLNAFVLVPFLYEAFKSGGTFSYYTQNVSVYDGNADLRIASLPYITRFFNSNLIDPISSLGKFLGNPLFSIWTFFLWIIAFLSVFFVKSKKEKRIIYILFFGFVSFTFLAKGANPPFGEAYKFILFNLPIFKIFRTTSIASIGGTLFFATLVTISMYYLIKGRQLFFVIVLLIHVTIFSPIYLGYKLITFEEKDQVKKGYSIPKEYYEMGDRLDNMKEDIKILSLPLDNSYSYKDWSYIGISTMAWITKKPFIHGQVAGYPDFTDNLILQRMSIKESCYWTAVNNIGYLLKEKDSRISYSFSKFNFSTSSVLENSYFKLDKIKSECFLPHIYASTGIFMFEGENNSIPNVSRFIKDKQDIVIGLDNPINKKKDFLTVPQIVIEAYPNETSNLSDNIFTKKVVSDIKIHEAFDFWTYSFNTPIEGEYQMVIDREGDATNESKALKKGNNSVRIPISRSANLIDFDSFVSTSSATPLSQVIKKWEGDAIYLISLKYKANEKGNLALSIDERQRQYIGRNPHVDLNATVLFKELHHKSPGVYEYYAMLRSDKNAQESTISIRQAVGLLSIESIAVEKVIDQKVFFTKIIDEKKIPPAIVSTKINPTRYVVDVKNAKLPYNLVFSESFSSDWKAYVKTCTTSCTLLQDWFLKPIAENQHVVVNGFANGWNITPKDSSGKANYTVIIEYWSQRLFYISIIISILTLVFCMILEIMHRKRKKQDSQ